MQLRAEALPECTRGCCPWRQAERIAENAQIFESWFSFPGQLWDDFQIAPSGGALTSRVDFLFVGSEVWVVHESGVSPSAAQRAVSCTFCSERRAASQCADEFRSWPWARLVRDDWQPRQRMDRRGQAERLILQVFQIHSLITASSASSPPSCLPVWLDGGSHSIVALPSQPLWSLWAAFQEFERSAWWGRLSLFASTAWREVLLCAAHGAAGWEAALIEERLFMAPGATGWAAPLLSAPTAILLVMGSRTVWAHLRAWAKWPLRTPRHDDVFVMRFWCWCSGNDDLKWRWWWWCWWWRQRHESKVLDLRRDCCCSRGLQIRTILSTLSLTLRVSMWAQTFDTNQQKWDRGLGHSKESQCHRKWMQQLRRWWFMDKCAPKPRLLWC